MSIYFIIHRNSFCQAIIFLTKEIGWLLLLLYFAHPTIQLSILNVLKYLIKIASKKGVYYGRIRPRIRQNKATVPVE